MNGNLALEDILEFATGAREEPLLGFALKPSITFTENPPYFMPTANTCINQLSLPRTAATEAAKQEEFYYKKFDLAFCNKHFGKK